MALKKVINVAQETVSALRSFRLTQIRKRGFALLIAVIFTSVMLAIGIAVASLGYKQALLVSSSIESQYAFYAADTALECALFYDQRSDAFNYGNGSASANVTTACDTSGVRFVTTSYNSSLWVTQARYSLDGGGHCADVSVYKYSPTSAVNPATYIFSTGYDTSCATVGSPTGARFVSRGLEIHY